MKYLEMVKADVKEWMQDNDWRLDAEADRDDIEQELNDILWIEDSVTGNGSGSYTFNRNEARDFVLADIDTVKEALTEFCTPAEEIGKRFLEEDWEYFDVTARCFVLGWAISEVLDEEYPEA